MIDSSVGDRSREHRMQRSPKVQMATIPRSPRESRYARFHEVQNPTSPGVQKSKIAASCTDEKTGERGAVWCRRLELVMCKVAWQSQAWHGYNIQPSQVVIRHTFLLQAPP